MDNLEEKKKPSLILKFVKSVLSLIFFGPSLRVLSLNKKLAHCKAILLNQKKESEEAIWFGKQIFLNYIVALFLALPLTYALYKGTTYIENDPYLAQRVEKVSQMNQQAGIVDAVANYYYILVESSEDSMNLRMQKYETKVRIVAFFVMFGFMLALHLLGDVISRHHPLIEDSEKTKNLFVRNSLIRQEDAGTALVFTTPLGVLLDTMGNSPHEIAHLDRIWMALNIKINKKEWVEDPNKRSYIFLKKEYELKPKYMYEIAKKKKTLLERLKIKK